uniref:Ig-like domain-containing protein n=1 Tax=Cyclopterus lumpus TaxID=8103 RepID=A0A8C3G3Y5_CYCLU
NSSMSKTPHLCLLLLLAGQLSLALTATPEGLRVRQHPPSLNVMRGETATLSCHFKVESLKYGVQWFRLKSGKQPLPKSHRRSVVEKNQTSSLVMAEVALEDAGWYYCEVNVLQRDPECGNGTELKSFLGVSLNALLHHPNNNPYCMFILVLLFVNGFSADLHSFIPF